MNLVREAVEFLKWKNAVFVGHIESLADIEKAAVAVQERHVMAVYSAVPFRQLLPFLIRMRCRFPLIDPPVVADEKQTRGTAYFAAM